MSTSTAASTITNTTADVVGLGGVAIADVLGIAVSLLIIGYFWSRLRSRAVHAKGF